MSRKRRKKQPAHAEAIQFDPRGPVDRLFVGANGTVEDIVSVTYNGVPLTLLRHQRAGRQKLPTKIRLAAPGGTHGEG